jgi:hypothetical protein
MPKKYSNSKQNTHTQGTNKQNNAAAAAACVKTNLCCNFFFSRFWFGGKVNKRGGPEQRIVFGVLATCAQEFAVVTMLHLTRTTAPSHELH